MRAIISEPPAVPGGWSPMLLALQWLRSNRPVPQAVLTVYWIAANRLCFSAIQTRPRLPPLALAGGYQWKY